MWKPLSNEYIAWPSQAIVAVAWMIALVVFTFLFEHGPGWRRSELNEKYPNDPRVQKDQADDDQIAEAEAVVFHRVTVPVMGICVAYVLGFYSKDGKVDTPKAKALWFWCLLSVGLNLFVMGSLIHGTHHILVEKTYLADGYGDPSQPIGIETPRDKSLPAQIQKLTNRWNWWVLAGLGISCFPIHKPVQRE